jgi:excisionase family DNA binding protein
MEPVTIEQLRRAAEALPPHSFITLPREALLEALSNGAEPSALVVSEAARSDELLTAREVAARLGVKPRFVYAHAGSWSFTRHLGRSLRFSSRGLEDWLSRRR